MDNNKKLYSSVRFRKALRAFLFGRAIQGIANLALTLWVVRLFEPDNYGAYMALWGMIEMLVPISSLGLLHAMRRYLPDLATRGSAQAVRSFVRWITVARFVVLLICAAILIPFWQALTLWLGFNAEQVGQTSVAIAVVVTVLGFRFTSEMLECLLEQRWSQAGQSLLPIGRLIGVAVLVMQQELSLANLLLVDLLVSLGCLVLVEVALLRKLKGLQVDGAHRVARREIMVFAWHMAGMNLLQATANAGTLRLLVARMLGLEAAGLFAFLQQLLTIVSRYMPAQLLTNIIRPMLISSHASGDVTAVPQGVALMWKSNLLIVLACAVVFAVAGDGLIALASGGRFTEAGLVMLILFVGLGASSQANLIALAMQIYDRAKELRNQSALVLLVPLLSWLGAAYGMLGMALGMVAGQWIRNSFGLWWMKRQGVEIPLDLTGLIRSILAASVAGAGGWYVLQMSSEWFGLAVSLAIITLGSLLAKPLCAADQALIARVLKGKARLTQRFVHR